jgi:uncharacterized membrane protein
VQKGRLEAFSDGVLAIIITIMVLELKVPHGTELGALLPLLPVFACYVLSFIYLGIYWNNHHHLFHAVKRVHGGVLWANLHLLFWLSLIPWMTGWVAEHGLAPLPVAGYTAVLLGAAIAYYILVRALIAAHEENAMLAAAVGNDFKGKISIVFYAVAIPLAFVVPMVSCACIVIVAAIWLIPDRRIEHTLS